MDPIKSIDSSIAARDESIGHGILFRAFVPLKLNGEYETFTLPGCNGYIIAPKLVPFEGEPDHLWTREGRIYVVAPGDDTIFDDTDAYIECTRELLADGSYRLTEFKASGIENRTGFAYAVITTGINEADGDLVISLGEAANVKGVEGFFHELTDWWASKVKRAA